ncbi:unnamed protein product [Effrenium voratum]|nr:unnamed protein product [Effrenium voratum]
MAKAHQSVMASVSKWAMGADKGNKKTAFQAWATFTKQSKQSERSRQAVHASLLASFMNKEKAALIAAFKNWVSLTKSEKAERDKEDVLKHQREHWEAETERLRSLHDQALRGTLNEKDRLKAQAQAQTELAIRKFLSMNDVDVSEYFIMWRRLTEAMKDSNKKRTAVQDAMTRFIEGERKGVMHSTFKSWATYVQKDAKQQAQLSRLEKQVESLLRKQEQAMQKYATFLAGTTGPALKGLVFRRWFEMSQGEKTRLEMEREREVVMEEMARKHKMNDTHKREMRAKSLQNLGMKGDRVVLLDVFLNWSYAYQKAKQARVHRMTENKALTKYSQYVLGKKLKQDNASLLASSFSEWRREGKILAHEQAIVTLEERDVYIAQLKAGFEEQLALAYQQIDQITETLQKELQTKEELAQELRDAYEKNRKMNLPDYPATPGSATPSSNRRGGTRNSSTERRGASLTRQVRHSAPATTANVTSVPSNASKGSCPNCGNTYMGEGNYCRKCGHLREAPFSEPLSRVEPMVRTTGALGLSSAGGLGLLGSASGPSSPRREVGWGAVVERLEDRGIIHEASGRRY